MTDWYKVEWNVSLTRYYNDIFWQLLKNWKHLNYIIPIIKIREPQTVKVKSIDSPKLATFYNKEKSIYSWK